MEGGATLLCACVADMVSDEMERGMGDLVVVIERERVSWLAG